MLFLFLLLHPGLPIKVLKFEPSSHGGLAYETIDKSTPFPQIFTLCYKFKECWIVLEYPKVLSSNYQGINCQDEFLLDFPMPKKKFSSICSAIYRKKNYSFLRFHQQWITNTDLIHVLQSCLNQVILFMSPKRRIFSHLTVFIALPIRIGLEERNFSHFYSRPGERCVMEL